MNNTTNRINPLIITNLLLAVIAGTLVWTAVSPSVEPTAQAYYDDTDKSLNQWLQGQPLKTARQWHAERFGEDYPYNVEWPNV